MKLPEQEGEIALHVRLPLLRKVMLCGNPARCRKTGAPDDDISKLIRIGQYQIPGGKCPHSSRAAGMDGRACSSRMQISHRTCQGKEASIVAAFGMGIVSFYSKCMQIDRQSSPSSGHKLFN